MAQSPIQLQRNSEVSGKSKHALWAKKQNRGHRTAFGSKKIHIAIEQAFAPETVDLNHVSERIQAAFSYFLNLWMT
jgi:hypothetical protein